MICIIIPVLNEIDNIQQLIISIMENLGAEKFEILFIDDGSTDGTLEFIRKTAEEEKRIKLINRKKIKKGCKRGKALADGLKQSVAVSENDIFVEMDGDLSHNPGDLKNGIGLIRSGHDVAIGSKYLALSKIQERAAVRNLVSFLNSGILRLLISNKVKDYSNGYRFYNRKAAITLLQHEIKNEGPVYLGEALAIWLSSGMKIIEFPSVYTGRLKGASKVTAGDIWISLKSVFDIFVRYRFTGFKTR